MQTERGIFTFKFEVSNLEVIFHKRVRVFYQELQTRENNENHEAVNRVTLVVLECL